MSQNNPYAPATVTSPGIVPFRQVKVRPIELLKRSFELIREQYWLFLGITVVGMIVGSAVPFALILGPMLVGIYLCYLARERGEQVEFSLLFKGFDQFKESFIACLMVLAVSMVVIIPMMIAMFALVLAPTIAAAQQNAAGGGGAPPAFPVAFLVMYPVMLLANIVIAIPFVFTFQLIAERKLGGVDAVKLSFQAVLKNLAGVVWYMIVVMAISLVLTMMCYVPGILFFPISFGSIFLLYRDVFPNTANLS